MATSKNRFKQAEIQLLQRLRNHPELLERLQDILQIADNSDQPLRTADEVEALLIEEVRQLGKTAMETWARTAEAQVEREAKEKDPTLGYGKKKR